MIRSLSLISQTFQQRVITFHFILGCTCSGGVVSKFIVISVATALMKKHLKIHLNDFDLDSSGCVQSLFKRMSFARRMGITCKVKILQPVWKEIKASYLHVIVKTIDENNVKCSLVINLNQTQTKYIPGTNKTMLTKVSKTIYIRGSTDECKIPATFTTILNGKFLPSQLIYGGKTTKSFPL